MTASIAQTPCFAETPNTTDQFKGYKIHDKGELSNSLQHTQVQIIMINNVKNLELQAAAAESEENQFDQMSN
jgi:hypothetical protein